MNLSAQNTIYISARGETVNMLPADTEAARELTECLSHGPITVDMSAYGGFEMVGDLPMSLPSDDRQLTTSPGDVMLYLGRSIVMFYGSNSWDYTPLGRIDGMTAADIKRFLSGSAMTVTLSLESSDISSVKASPENHVDTIYDLSGRLLKTTQAQLSPGIYIINGNKTVIK